MILKNYDQLVHRVKKHSSFFTYIGHIQLNSVTYQADTLLTPYEIIIDTHVVDISLGEYNVNDCQIHEEIPSQLINNLHP